MIVIGLGLIIYLPIFRFSSVLLGSESALLMKSPADLNFRMPGEWEPHKGTWMSWPRPDGISFPDKYEKVLPTLVEMVRLLVEGEDVHINVWDEDMEVSVRKLFKSFETPLERVYFHHFPTYEPWCRDHGPIFLVRDTIHGRERAVVNFKYNAWGEKYPPFDLDNQIPQQSLPLRV